MMERAGGTGSGSRIRRRVATARRRLRRVVAVVLPVTLAVSLGGQVPALAARPKGFQGLKPQVERSVPGTTGAARAKVPADPARAAAVRVAGVPVWPAAGVAVADLSTVTDPRPAQRGPARPGTLPVLLDAPKTATSAAAVAGGGQPGLPRSVRVEVLDHGKASAAHQPLILRVGRADAAAAGRVALRVDYSKFRNAYGGDWASRLRLVQLPECALSTPDAPGCQPIPLASSNDVASRTVSADVTLPAGTASGTGSGPKAASGAAAAAPATTSATMLVAATAAPSGAAGDFTATKLSPSSTWQAGGSSGDFSWSYPMRVPPSLGGPAPQVTLAYSAQSVDGHTAASNNQPSWVGEGFDYNPGSISRAYKACADDMGGSANNTTKTGDLCWATDNATLTLSGHSGELIRDDASGGFRLKDDDGTRVERLTGAGNGDNDGEYWKVTTSDGTQYFFGLNRLTGWTSGKATTNSTWTVPVFGNNPGEPCNQSSFASSWCAQAWQWNLDYVVDTHGNTMSYWYGTESNNYARNVTDASVSGYVRGGYLTRIDYGTDNRSGTDTEYTGTAPMRVNFTVADRCIPGSTCDTAHPTSWPDVPWDQNCTSTTSCSGHYSPTFWTQKRLASVKTQVWNGSSAYRDVEQWTLNQTYPDPGDGTRAGLWLAGISHAGLVGGTVTLPDVTFTGYQMPNRVNTTDSSAPPMNWWRISYINTESGGIIGVTYSPQDCVWGSRMPASPDSNTMRCYPVYWTRDGQTQPTIDWFHKYVVSQVTETDGTGGAPRVVTSYTYPNSPAWHYSSDNGTVATSRETWADWRGYDQVNVTTGDPGQQTYAVTRFFRGMNGDHLSSGGTRSVSVDGIADDDAYAGMTRETISYNGPGGAEVAGTTSTPWESTPTASRTINGITTTARHTGTAVVKTRTDLDGGRAPRTSTVTTTFDNTYGYPTQVADAGDDAVSTDDRCTVYTRVNNTTAWVIGAASRTQVYALSCGQTPASDAQVISDSRTYFDGQAYGAAPTRGDVTQSDTAKAWTSPSTITWLTTAKSTYDAYGRVTDAVDVRGNHTTTAHTPASGGPVTEVVTTNALGWKTTVDYEPAWGAAVDTIDANGRRTDATYDGLGRRTAVWKPGRQKATQTASITYAYSVSTTTPTSVTTKTLNPAGNYVTTYQLYDGLLRTRQEQGPSQSGSGRILSDTFYNTAGQVAKTNAVYYNSSAPGTTLFTPQDNQVPAQTVNTYDGAGRIVTSTLMSNGVEKWHTTTGYGGDHTDVTPPQGGTATSTYTDARGQKTKLLQYHGPTPTGAADTTLYGYNGKGQLAQLTDPAGKAWTYSYDLLGRTISSNDPDKGTITVTFNDAGDQLTSTDARSKTLAFSYDQLGRKTGLFDGSTTGTKLAAWTYDATLLTDGVTKATGQLSTSTRYVNGNAYTTTVRGYTDTYQQTGQNITIPASEGTLAGTYIFTNTYNVDGSVGTQRYPAGGGLTAETVTYGYDAATGKPTTLNTNFGGVAGTYVTSTQYTQLGEPTVTTMETGGAVAQRGLYYDEATRRLTEILTDKSTAPGIPADVHYSYDPAGDVTKIADTPTGGTADTQCLGYDYLQRLTTAWTPGSGDCTTAPTTAGLGGPAPYWLSWTFDATGDRLSQTQHTSSGDSVQTSTYQAPGHAHAVSSIAYTGVGGSHTATYGYDPAGNTTSRPGSSANQTLTWDSEGHLATLADNGKNNSYVYDPDGNRLVSHDATGATLYLPGVELRLTTSSGTVAATRYYTFNGETIAFRTASGLTWLSADQHGTAQIAIADTATQTVTQRRETPYGTPRGSTPTWPTPHGFVNGVTDPTGLTHVGAREYDPGTGRFISVDPLLDIADPQQMNGYSYANNNPTTASDPSGLVCVRLDDRNGPCAGSPEVPSYVAPQVSGDDGPQEQPAQQYDGANGTHTVVLNDGTTTVNGLTLPTQHPEAMEFSKYIDEARKKYPYFNSVNYENELRLMLAGCELMNLGGGECSMAFYGEINDRLNEAINMTYPKANGIWAAMAVPFSVAVDASVGFGSNRFGGLKVRSCNSFDPETPVLMADGSTKAIKDVQVGDRVEATDPTSHTTNGEPVTQLHLNRDTDLADVTVAAPDGTQIILHTTQSHPFWDATTQRWTLAAQLQPGDTLHTPSGDTAHVVTVRSFTGSRDMHNLTVDDLHTYYVLAGNTPVLVHNTPCEPLSAPNPVPRAVRNAYEDIRASGGQQRFNSDGTPDIFTGTHGESPSVQRKWGGSTVWEVPGARNPGQTRILVNPRGQMGYTTDHYKTIHEFSAPHYPDWGW